MVEIFFKDVLSIQPSQLYISEKKLKEIQLSLNSNDPHVKEPIPIKNIDGKTIFVDGHTRAVAIYLLGQKTIPVYWEYEELDWELYKVCVQWCIDENIHSIEDLAKRIIPQPQYEQLWYKRCDELHVFLE
jgi:hypothetical protein